MLSFPFTRKRFLSLPEARRQKWVGNWLRKNFLEISNGNSNPRLFDDFFQQYARIMEWLSMPIPSKPEGNDVRYWIEFIADRFHLHQQATGLGLGEGKFLPEVIRGDKLSMGPRQVSIPYKVALDNLRSAFNVGSILRTIDAVGFDRIIIGGQTPNLRNPQVRKTSKDTEQWIPEEIALDLATHLQTLRATGVPIIGVETVKHSISVFDYPWSSEAVLVLGNEEYGLTQKVLLECDAFVHLPMQGRKNSLNVANAFAVVAYAIFSSLNCGKRGHV